jgi:hypothetical protein
MAENYIHPPIVALEARSQRAAVWRFRAYLIIALLLLAVGILLVARAIVGNGEGSPDVGGQTLAAAHHFLGATRTG